ncbi:tubulinyl-Tyr carboxypeptidase 1-like [Babylonia areolata]|uniref:tubulinyl-Tyr carboxypeptidase 1-like n=1 Tax=Babylonia areolata TaxID=304850 RepID=UPI003FD0657E
MAGSRKGAAAAGDDVHEENGVLFWINRSGFPMDERTWDRMWDHVARNHPEGVKMTNMIRDQATLPEIAVPQPPLNFSPVVTIPERLERIQKYMTELEYNHTGTQFYEIRKNRPVTGLMECAKEMIREALPIKCLEAVILGIFLTNGMIGIERFPLSFKSIHNGNVYRHVVLGVYHGGRYGAIGMSRRDDLMYKPLTYKSLSDLVFDFEKCYIKYWHDLRKVKVGMPVSHDQHSYEMVNWKSLALNMARESRKELTKQLELHSRNMRAKAKSWTTNSQGPKSISTLVDNASVRDTSSKARDPSPVRIARVKSLSDPSRSRSPTRRNSSNKGEASSEYGVRM